MVLLGGNLNLSLATQSTSLVNSIPIAFTVANVPILLATLATNIWAIQIIQRKETSRINRFFQFKSEFSPTNNSNRQFCNVHSRLIMWDCLMNILTMILATFVHSPWYTHRFNHLGTLEGQVLLKSLTNNLSSRVLLKCNSQTTFRSRSIWTCTAIVFLLNALHTWNRMVRFFFFKFA